MSVSQPMTHQQFPCSLHFLSLVFRKNNEWVSLFIKFLWNVFLCHGGWEFILGHWMWWGALGWDQEVFVIVRQLLIPLADGWLTFWNKILQETGERKKRSMGRRHLKDWEGRNKLSAPRFEEDFIVGHRSLVSLQPGCWRPGMGDLVWVFLSALYWPYQANWLCEKWEPVNLPSHL